MKINVKQTIDKRVSPDAVIKLLLKDRGIANSDAFMNPPHPSTVPLKTFFTKKPSFKKKWVHVLKLLKKIHKDGKTIVVYTDYDADGVTGGAIMWETLHKLGFKAMPYIPDRKKEGYGFSVRGLDHVKKEFDPALIISVDHGIVAHTQISYAKKLGMPIVVTDHHQKQEKEPQDALAVFHITALSGSGVAYFVAKEIASDLGGVLEAFNRDFIALAAIGTIADLVPLTGMSRSIAKYGLEAFNRSVRYGLQHILKEAGLEGRKITPYDVGYIIAPRINAFGRLDHAIEALRLLCTTSYGKAVALAAKAGNINKTRQHLVDSAQKKAQAMADTNKKIIIVHHDEWEEGIIGLIAGKLMNKHNKPVIVMTRSDGHVKASVRSVRGIDITAFLTSPELRGYLIDVGGHAAAAGFSLPLENIEAFTKAAYVKAEKEITDEMLIPVINVDFQMPLRLASLELIQKLTLLEPYGIDNPQPYFLSQGSIKGLRPFGKRKEYIKILMYDDDRSFLEIAFFDKPNISFNIGDKISVVYTLKIDAWGGKLKVAATGRYIEPTATE